MKNLPVASLQFDQIKQNLTDFLKGNPDYSDFNFEASGISTILNLMSYQTHYLGYFVKMLLDESFVDTAHTRQALLSHAKTVSYIPRGLRAARAEIQLTVTTDTASEPPSHSLVVPRGATFTATNASHDSRVFSVLDGITIYDRVVDGTTVTYTSEPLAIYEGTLREWKFKAKGDVVNQRFIIRDRNIDIDTIRVRVRENESATEAVDYFLPRDLDDLTPDTPVFFVTTDENGYYQISFGDNVFGIQPSHDNLIEVVYISTSGPSGNGARQFVFNAPAPVGSFDIGNFEDFAVTTLSRSSGGMDEQSVDDLRFAIPNHYRRQNRLVTAEDYRGVLLEEFRNIESLNVWGGETNYRREYGKIFVSIKPRFSDSLTAMSREEIRNSIVRKFGVIGADVVFVDPDFINVDIVIRAKYDQRRTTKSSAEVTAGIVQKTGEYNDKYLSRFDQLLSDVDLLSYIRDSDTSIVSLFSEKQLWKMVPHIHGSTATNTVSFSNPIEPKSLFSSNISYGNLVVRIEDDGVGGLVLRNVNTGDAVASAGEVDYTTGQVEYRIPMVAKIAGFEGGSTGTMRLTAEPSVPDINTTQNNIVRIRDIKAFVKS